MDLRIAAIIIVIMACVATYFVIPNNNTTEIPGFPVNSDYEIAHVGLFDLPIPTPTQGLDPIDILLNGIIENNVANKSYYSMLGGSKDVHVCGNMAVEQAEWIAHNYGYETGIVILWAKHQGESHAQTWVMINDDRYIFESTFDTYWTELDHKANFSDSNKICFVSIKKGREHVKATAEYIREG